MDGLTRETIDALLATAGIRPGRVRSVRPMAGGTFNAVHRVELADGTGLVLKVAPDPAGPVMSYERHILRTEALYYRLAEPLRLPVPRLRYAGFDRDAGDVLLMSECPGTPWHLLDGRVGTGDTARLRGELGRIVAGLHTLTGTGFGYPAGALGPLAPTWPAAFGAMVAAVLDDADRFGVRLPRPAGDVRAALDRYAVALGEVTTPVLVHFDLWDGNILVDGARIGGLIDAERAFWGDPLAELVSLALFGSIEDDEAFLAGYRAAGGRARFDAAERARLSLYRIYLYLIMLVEAAPRGSDEARRRWLDQRVVPPLLAELDAVSV